MIAAVGQEPPALSLYCLAWEGLILRALGALWDEPLSDASAGYVAALENAFRCCGRSESRPSCRDQCSVTLGRMFSKGFAASLLLFSLAPLTGCAFAVRALLVPELPSDRDESLSESLIGPARSHGRSRHYNVSAW
jgi:hypothetical protein